MQNAAQAYGSVARKIANPRELEADLLLKAAARLQAVQDGWDATKGQLNDALLHNRKLWSIFLTSMAEPDCALPMEIRQNIANLGMFIVNHTFEVMNEPRPESLGVLVNINRQIASGLLGR
jgi:flagellar biosynthesis activator protein FlaF